MTLKTDFYVVEFQLPKPDVTPGFFILDNARLNFEKSELGFFYDRFDDLPNLGTFMAMFMPKDGIFNSRSSWYIMTYQALFWRISE